MMCPVCHGEYRSGFTRCAECDVDLVDELPVGSEGTREADESTEGDLVPYCGFLSIDEARGAREKLRIETIRSEILIRDAPGGTLEAPVGEEYWLRVPACDFPRATRVLGYDPAEAPDTAAGDETFACSECSKPVGASESFCAHCGATFE